MDFLRKNKVIILSVIVIILLISSVFLWNFIVDKQKEAKNKNDGGTIIDPLEINNVPNVDSKLNGEDYRITQLYLLSYTKHKGGIWYMSNGYISKISFKDNEAIITIKENKNSSDSIIATIGKDKANVKIGDTINFVGTIDIKTGEVHLSKISTEEINYASVTKIEIKDLVINIKLLQNTYFVIDGYMVTDNEKYKLYDSKENYKIDSSAGRYFLIDWADEFNYTGNQDVTIRCQLKDTYMLKNCSLISKNKETN